VGLVNPDHHLTVTHQEAQSLAGAVPPAAGVHQPVRASMSVSAEKTASGALAKIFVAKKSSVTWEWWSWLFLS